MLNDTPRAEVQRVIAAGTAPARQLAHARILLNADQSPDGPAWGDDAIADALEISQSTVSRVRKQCVEQGLPAARNRRMPRRLYTRKLDGAQVAPRLAVACTPPPPRQARWSLRLLADTLVELEVVAAGSYQTMRPVCGAWRMCWMYTHAHTSRAIRRCAWTT